MKMKKGLAVLFIIVFFLSCKDQRECQINCEKINYGAGDYTYLIKTENNEELRIGFSKDGKLKYFSNYPGNYEQMISFFENGVIQSKLKVYNFDKANDRAYYFYEGSGNLSSSYNYENGVKTGSAISYHDSSDHIKEIMLYNSEGELFSRKTYNWAGELIKTEGSRSLPKESR